MEKNESINVHVTGIWPLVAEAYRTFDSTLGYPGEGWETLKITTWNTRSLTYERFQYYNSLQYDILAITELWRNQSKFQTRSKKIIVSAPKTISKGPKKGKIRFPEDKAAGVGLLLSSRIANKVTAFGSEGERICWVWIRGPLCHLFVIAIYLPHRGRTLLSQDDTLADLRKVLSNVPSHDCVCILGDLNEQVDANIQGHTGRWTGGPASKNANKINELLRLYQLAAVNIMFQPKRNKSVCTFLQTESTGSEKVNDFGKYVGRKVKAQHNDKWIAISQV